MMLIRLLFLVLVSGLALGQSTFDGPQPWPERVWGDLSREVDRSGSLLTNVIFDQLDDFEWSKEKSDITVAVGVRRSVRDNQDVLNTWTVNDEISVDLSRNATDYSFPLVPSVTSPVNLNLGVGGRLKVNHIRQVFASRYHELPTVEGVKSDFGEEKNFIQVPEQKWYEFDPSLRPRFSKLWNPLLNFYRIPWTKAGLGKLGKGEIISYSASGFVSVGLESGFLPLKLTKGVDLSLGVGVQAFVKGEFRITLLKEDDRYVRVKLTRVRSTGTGLTIGAKTSEIQVFEGFLLFEGKKLETRLLETGITVIPFKFSWDMEKRHDFNLGFRYDLEDPEAELAFEKAMRGNFSYSENLLEKSKAIEHILTRNALEKRRAFSVKLGTDWLMNWRRHREGRNQWITLERPDGTSEIFKSSLEHSRAWSTFWGTGERKNFVFTTVWDRSAFERNEENSFQLVTEVLYEDVRTSGKEMHHYLKDVESVVGDTDILPELPILVPDKDDDYKEASYGRSSFYFGQYISQKQVVKFLLTPAEKAWEISLKSFSYLKLKAHRKLKARRFHRHWMRLQERFRPPMKIEEMASALEDLRSLFGRHRTAIYALSTLIAALDKEPIDYFITATNHSFGRIQFRGRTITNAERLLQLADEAFEFENKVGNIRPNPDAEIRDLKLTQVSEKLLKASYSLPVNPNYLYFKLLRTSGWKRVKTVKEFVYLNKDKFKEGKNDWTISATGPDHLERELFDGLKKSDYYTLQVSASPDRKSWGRLSTVRFKFEVPESDLD